MAQSRTASTISFGGIRADKFIGSNFLITGGTGSLGSVLVKHLRDRNYNVTVLSRDGHKQSALKARFPEVSFLLGDICDYDLVLDACKNQHYVIHCAAQKIVCQGEKNVREFIRVNLTGSQVVARACMEQLVPAPLLISSDKAVNPVNLYGKTKSIAEDIFLSYGYSCLRYGNVVDSRGSFYSIWNKLREEGKRIVLRKPDPTRFFLTLDDAVMLVDEVINNYIPRNIYIPHSLRAFSIADIASAMGFHNDEIDKTPLLKGEKQHEVLLAGAEQGKKSTKHLASIRKSYVGNLDHANFCSASVPRISGSEFITRVGIK